jgi:N-acetylglucosaminyldiphosphoundecaprenol N-acetyl-beta-D-mannosaminyltransferase
VSESKTEPGPDGGLTQTDPAGPGGSGKKDQVAEDTKPKLGMELGAKYRAQKKDFLGIGLSCLSDEEFVAAVSEAVRTRSRLTVSFINADYAVKGNTKPGLMEKMNIFDVVLPDGWGIVMGGRWLGLPVPDRQSNDDICPKVFAASAEHKFSNFLFGCGEGIPEKAAENLTATFPGLPIAGCLYGYQDVARGHPGRYDEADVDMMVETINASGADILHVSIPTPMQQNWVAEVGDRLNVPVIITGGSYLDHLAERVYWYPPLVIKYRIAWLYRLSREPGRLWKRYTLDLASYGAMVAKQKLRPRSARSAR